MANYQPLIGFQPLAGTLQAPLASVSKAVETIAEEFSLDNTLPVLGEIMTDGRITYVTVPKFRAVGIKSRAIGSNNAGSKPTLTIATGGGTVDPVGVAQFDLYKEFNNVPQGMQSVFEKRQYIRFPFLNGTAGDGTTVYNSNINGELLEGAPIAPDAHGRPSLFVPRSETSVIKKVTVSNGVTESIEIVAVAAKFNPNVPRAITVFNLTDGTVIPSTSYALTYDTDGEGALSVVITAGSPAVVATNNVIMITLGYGHSSTKKYGTVGRILTGIDENTLAGFIRNQVNNDYPLAPIMNPVFVTQVTSDNIVIGTTYSGEAQIKVSSAAIKYIDLSKPFVVELNLDTNGTTWTPLDNASMSRLYANVELGSEFSVNALSGTIEYQISTDRTLTARSAIRVKCSYKTAQSRTLWEQGAYGNNGGGIYGQTDGSVAGTFPVMKPAAAVHPDGADFAGKTVAQMKLSGIMNIILD